MTPEKLDRLIAEVHRWHMKRHDLNTDPGRTRKRLQMQTLPKVLDALHEYRDTLGHNHD